MFMSGQDFRESLRSQAQRLRQRPQGQSVAGDAELAPGVNAIALTYDYASGPSWRR